MRPQVLGGPRRAAPVHLHTPEEYRAHKRRQPQCRRLLQQSRDAPGSHSTRPSNWHSRRRLLHDVHVPTCGRGCRQRSGESSSDALTLVVRRIDATAEDAECTEVED
eukprot:1164930-Prymnesium_polylepis.1